MSDVNLSTPAAATPGPRPGAEGDGVPPPPPPVPDSMLGPATGGNGEMVHPYAEIPPAGGNFWRQPWVQNVLPLVTSLILHISLIVIGYATYKTVEKVVQVVQEQIIIPESTLAENGPPGGIPHPGLGGDPTRDAAQDLEKDAGQEGWATKASDQLNAALMGGSAADSDATSISNGINLSTGGRGNGIGGSGADGGALAPFGVPGGGSGIGPKSSFAGTGGNAHRIMYFCDASGSMVPVFAQLRVELKKSIDGLKPVQSFNVVFFSGDQFSAFNKDGLVMATPDNKRAAYQFIDDQVAHGQTEPIPAIKFAMSNKPELMYLLTDGFDNISNYDDVTNTIRAGNPDHKVHINCILLKSNDDPKLEQVLHQISSENGGNTVIKAKSEF
jgi:hypothetical protein